MRRLILSALLTAACASAGNPASPDAFVVPNGPDAAPQDQPDATPAQATPADIRDVQNGTVPTGTYVEFTDVIVTARGEYTPDGATAPTATYLFVQDPSGDPKYSGVLVYVKYPTGTPPFALPSRGDLVIVDGTVAEFASGSSTRTEIDNPTRIDPSPTTPVPAIPTPYLMTTTDLASPEPWEGVLVEVMGVHVQTSSVANNEFTLDDGLAVGPLLYDFAVPAPNDTYEAIIGPLDNVSGGYRILPRDGKDLIGYTAGPASVTSLTPAPLTVGVGLSATMTVTLDRAAETGGQLVNITNDNTTALTAPTSVTVAAGSTTATFTVTGKADGVANVTAAVASETTGKSVVTVSSAAAPSINALSQTSLDVLAGGTAIVYLEMGTTVPVPAGGVDVTVTSSDPSVSVPATVHVPEAATIAGFRIKGVTAGSSTIQATLGGTAPTATVNVVSAAQAPVKGDLVFNEIAGDLAADVAGTTYIEGDWNCDNSRVGTDDEYVEIVNVSPHVLDLANVSIWDNTAWTATTPAPKFSFASGVTLGPGEIVVVFGGAAPATSTDTTAPWCANYDGTHIGDALAFGSSGLSLNNSGDTLFITPTKAKDTTNYVTTTTYASASNTSWQLTPEVTGSTYTKFNMVTGHIAWGSSPGYLVTGQPFVAATAP